MSKKWMYPVVWKKSPEEMTTLIKAMLGFMHQGICFLGVEKQAGFWRISGMTYSLEVLQEIMSASKNLKLSLQQARANSTGEIVFTMIMRF